MTLTSPFKFRAVLAAAGLAAAAASSEAAVIVADFSDTPFVVTQVNTFIGLDVINGTASYGTTGQFIMAFQNSSQSQPFFWPSYIAYTVLTVGDYSPMLQEGAIIDPNGQYTWGPYMASGSEGPWAEGGRGLIAFRLEDGEGGFNYGFADVSYDAVGKSLSLNGFAYDDTGAAVTASPIPEPSAMLLVGAGAVAGVLRRRRRN